MVGRKRATKTHPTTPHRLKKRGGTRITATPHHAKPPPAPRTSSQARLDKEIEDIRREQEEFWALPLPTSPAPSPPRPKEICSKFRCTNVADPNESQVYTYRKLYNELDQTLRDSLGREVAGRHRIPAREFTRDRSYMTPSTRAREDHGIYRWPVPPMEVVDNATDGNILDDLSPHERTRIKLLPTPPPTDPVREIVHTTGRKTVTRRPVRLFSDEREEGDKRVEGEDGNEENVKTGKGKGDTLVYTALAAQGDTVSKSSSRKRRASKATLKHRRRLYTGSVNSDGVRRMTSSEDEVNDVDENEGYDDVVDEQEKENGIHSYSGDFAFVQDEGEVDLNRTLEVEKDESDEEEDASGSKKMKDSIRVDEEDERQGDGSREDGNEGREEEIEELNDENDPEEDDEDEEDLSSEHDTLREEMSDSEEDNNNSDEMESVYNNSAVGDISLIDNTLPLESVVDSIADDDLRRMLAVCKQKNVMDIEEWMTGVESAVKVGEGSYGDAYLIKRKWEEEKKVFKIIALKGEGGNELEEAEGDNDGEKGKKLEDAKEVFGEVVISKDLTRLASSGRNSTSAFAKLFRASVIKGIFPPLLSDAWEHFRDHDADAEDELNPDEYGDDQLFLVLECEYGGLSLKKFPFSSVLEIISVYCQTVLALAVAEAQFKFEHRDLHEDNVLVKRTEDTVLEFTYDWTRENGDNNGVHQSIRVPTHGVKTTIIDFSLSRITRKPGDNSTEDINVHQELTYEVCHQEQIAEQYIVYKKMWKMTKGFWEKYTPKSNVLWLTMQMNWIIANILNAKSTLNLERVNESKSRRTIQGVKKLPKRQSTRKSTNEEEEVTGMSGETWLKKLKEGSRLISKLKNFAKLVHRLDSAQDVVASTIFKDLLSVLE